MNRISIVAMFCSDVRHEKGGTDTIVGVFPDNINVPEIPSTLAQICVYVRMHLDPEFRPSQIVTKLVWPDGKELDQSMLDSELLERTREKGIDNKTPYLGVITKFVLSPLHVTQEGRLNVIVSVDEVDHVAGSLNFRVPTKAKSYPIA